MEDMMMTETPQDVVEPVIEEKSLVESEILIPDTKVVNGKNMPIDMADDFSLARENLRTILKSGMLAITAMSELALDSEHPRIYEVLTGMMQTMSGINKQLVELNVEKFKISMELETANQEGDKNSGSTVIKNNVFVGTTKELQEIMNGNTVDIPSSDK